MHPPRRGVFLVNCRAFAHRNLRRGTDRRRHAGTIHRNDLAGQENAVRTLLSQSIAAGMDAVAFSTAAPGGLLNGVTPLTASAATPATHPVFPNPIAQSES